MEADMKKILFSALAVSVFFTGIGALVQETAAKFTSDEKALAQVAKTRQALGGDAAIRGIQSLRIVGSTTRTFKGETKSGDTEIAMQFPDRFMRNSSVGDGGAMSKAVTHERNITVTGGDVGAIKMHVGKGKADGHGAGAGDHYTVVLRNADGTTKELTGEEAQKWLADNKDKVTATRSIVMKKDGEAVSGEKSTNNVMIRRKADGEAGTAAGAHTFTVENGKVIMDGAPAGGMKVAMVRHNDFLKTALSLLMTAPEGMDVMYKSGGEADIDGTGCNVLVASFGGESYKFFIDRSTNLPVAMSYKTGVPHTATFTTKGPDKGTHDVVLERKIDGGAGGKGGAEGFTRTLAPAAEFTVRFADYRSVNGVQLPFRWTQTGGDAEEVFTVSNYEVNPANIAEKFAPAGSMIKTRKP
jgi:hypothetical protein